MFAIDSIGKVFPKNKIVCVSVKARISKRHKNYRPTIPIGSRKLLAAKEIWNVSTWVGIVVGSTLGDKNLAAFIFPLADLPKLRGKAARKDVVAVSELYKNATGRVVRLF